MADRQFTLSSGRKMGMTAVGEALSVRVVIMCHPMPGAGTFDPKPVISRKHEARILAFDRPGYGGSEPLGADEPSTVQARADDIAEFILSQQMADQTIGAPDVGVIGWGFGGAVALSLAARHPSVVSRVAVVGLSRPALWNEQDAPLPALVNGPPKPGPPTFDWDVLGIDSDDPALAYPGVSDRLDVMLAEAAAQGTIGVETDARAVKDFSWADELGSMVADTALIYGTSERFTNSASGRWLKRRIPHARIVRVPTARGLTIVSVWQQILDHVTA
ncbi:MAG: alpha/beta fold hydrolase [Terrimesophilobacter sp.]